MTSCFHPFQGRPSFGPEMVDRFYWLHNFRCFHPFQGRPSFGQIQAAFCGREKGVWFPSLSGKTFIRTRTNTAVLSDDGLRVSIPFREDLHSDTLSPARLRTSPVTVSIPFREDLHSDKAALTAANTEKQVSIPFREDLHSDSSTSHSAPAHIRVGFHPFQGRPSFGQGTWGRKVDGVFEAFPSLSGKTFIRTLRLSSTPAAGCTRLFPSLSGKTFIRTHCQNNRQRPRPTKGFHPFQGRPSFGQKIAEMVDRFYWLQFPSLSGKTFIRTQICAIYTVGFEQIVSIPFREDLHSDDSNGSSYWFCLWLSFPSLSGKTFIRT